MATLADTALFSKKFLILAVCGLLAILAIIILIGFGKSIKNSLFPPKPPPATVAFGKIPKLDLSEGVRASGLQFSLETVSGELPSLPDKLKVFENEEEESSFGALDAVKKKVVSLGFNDPPQLEGGNLVSFFSKDRSGLAKSLKINVSSNNLEYRVNFETDQALVSKKPPEVKEAIEQAESFLGNFNLNKSEFPKEIARTKLYRIEGINLVEVPSVSSSNLIEVVFTRAEIDGTPVMSPRISMPPITVLVSGNGIVSADVHKQNISFHKFSTYPLKSVRAAFDDLTAGKGYLNKDFNGKIFSIREVAIAYLETKTYQKYLQPVYIFKSDSGLIAYIEAVDGAWIFD
ncbi:hypothetical protein HY382_02710 [Candidatus Curtissbacteria bacterium]|nr:hypothetical protein [Candidatus Curtissbacteria bacterium]